MADIFFQHPEPFVEKVRIRPVFIPFMGCPSRCLYCAQWAQTGQGPRPLEKTLGQARADLREARATGREPMELGFFGGTFTAMKDGWPERFLELAREYRELGMVTRVRCSTRPDAVSVAELKALKEQGLDVIELGIQSFDARALEKARRGYPQETAIRSCGIVREAGLGLGIQLLPGMPGVGGREFQKDIDMVVRIKPDFVRLYPCLVLEKTALADRLEQGEYRPWPLSFTVAQLGWALLRLWRTGIPVIRVGLAPEAEMLEQVVAGPWHPAMGHLARGQALHALIRWHGACLGRTPKELFVPGRYLSEVLGHGKMFVPPLEAMDLQRGSIRTWDKPFFLLR